jgi:rhodanese-related sulfurtransferase/predicted peroxiredoxin
MCSTSTVNDMLGLEQTFTAKQVTAVKLKHSRDDFFVVDIREADEIASDPLPSDVITADAEMPMGKLYSLVAKGELEWCKETKIVLLCSSGRRSSVAASELVANGYINAASLQRGLIGLHNPAATIPDFLVILATKSDAEKITLALTACSAAAANGDTVVLGLMGNGVCTFLRKGNNKEEASPSSFRVEETFIGEPFKPCNTLLNKFIGTGNGVVIACTSCVQSRKLEFGSDLLDCVSPMQMPDLLRMLEEAKRNMQFM